MPALFECFQTAVLLGNPAEWAIVAAVIILFFGGGKIADFGRSLGEGIREFKKSLRDEKNETTISQSKDDK